MFDPLDVPGYDVLAPLGTGRTWKAIAVADRARVVLRRVYGGADTVARVRREAAVWGSVSGAHIVAVRDAFVVDPDVGLVVSDYAPGGGLDALLSRRGALDDGEVVTLVVPLAETLAEAHGRGLVHGRVSTGNVVFGHDGRPMLTDAALTSSRASGATADVAALVAVAVAALGDRRTGPVHDALATPVTSAAGLAAAVRAAAAARPISLHKPGPAMTPPTAPTLRSRQRRPLVLVGAVVAMALVAGVAWGRRDHAEAARMPVPQTSAPSVTDTPTAIPMRTTTGAAAVTAPASPRRWWAIIRQLEQDRVRAYATKLRRSGLNAVGLHMRLESVQVLTSTDDHAVVRVVDGWASYDVVGDDGHLAGHHPARLHRRVTLVLQQTNGDWRVQRVVR